MRETLVLFLLSPLLLSATTQLADKPVAEPITLLEDIRSTVDQAYTYLSLVKARLEHDESRLPEPTNMPRTDTRTDQETVRRQLELLSQIQDPKYYKEAIERIEAQQRILEKERQLNMLDCEVKVKSRLEENERRVRYAVGRLALNTIKLPPPDSSALINTAQKNDTAGDLFQVYVRIRDLQASLMSVWVLQSATAALRDPVLPSDLADSLPRLISQLDQQSQRLDTTIQDRFKSQQRQEGIKGQKPRK